MWSFNLWLLTESGRFDREGFNALFDRQLDQLLPHVTDARRRVALERMKGSNWIGYILTAVRNAGVRGDREQEEAAHDVAVHLLVSPGRLFAGYDPDHSGPMAARFALAVRNAVLNLRRSRRRNRDDRAVGIGPGEGEIAADKIPDRRAAAGHDDEIMRAFLEFVRRDVGEVAARMLSLKVAEELSQRELVRRPEFAGLGEWGVRKLMGQITDAARAFARRHGDDEFRYKVERLVSVPRRQDEWAGWSPLDPATISRRPSRRSHHEQLPHLQLFR